MSRRGFQLTILLGLLWVGCGEDGCTADVDPDAIVCTVDSQCDDGLHCNGVETCKPDDPFASRYGCVPGQVCRDRCDEEETAACFDDGGDVESCCNAQCRRNTDCDDRVFCNGPELCDVRAPDADSNGCVSSPPPCDLESETCDEINDACLVDCEDADGDGVPSAACGGADCNDADVSIGPYMAEICDANGVDEDCDPRTFGRDEDGDGFAPLECCNGDDCGQDCDDSNPGVHPFAIEVCNGRDDDCDGDIDEGVRFALYRDADGDGFGLASDTMMGCAGTAGYATTPGDCDDTNPQVFPGSIVCDPQPNGPNAYQFCEADGTFSAGQCDPQTEACVTQPGGHGVCTRP